ncbi:energy-coupling factor transporter transmembrane component T [Marinicrinis lubricantis]|uniref:Energy-coupling factor transporter transmembrane component T n=1 Tax=Marinicrinis lubricantis TaxID=2086470 RepID=A0ABW1IT34_9BACL
MRSDGLRGIHPAPALLYFLAAGICIMLFNHPFMAAFMLGMQILLSIILDKGRSLWRLRWVMVIGFGFVALLNPLFNHRGMHILFYFMDQPITGEALLYGVNQAMMLISLILLFVSFQTIIDPPKFLNLFARFSPKAALIVTMAFRFVPLFRKRLENISMVQRTKGITVSSGTLKQRWLSGMRQLETLLTLSMEESVQTAESMAARGYGPRKRTSYVPYRWKLQDVVFASAVFVLWIACFGGWFLGKGQLIIYPRLEEWQLDSGDTIILVTAVLLHAVPFIVEGRDYLLWRT